MSYTGHPILSVLKFHYNYRIISMHYNDNIYAGIITKTQASGYNTLKNTIITSIDLNKRSVFFYIHISMYNMLIYLTTEFQ